MHVARCTTLVTFAPGSSFEMHSHGGGEEFLVLEGDFCDKLTGMCKVNNQSDLGSRKRC